MMAVTGAFMVLSTLPSLRAGLSRALPSADVTNSTRMGLQLALVGPIFARSWTRRSRSSGTGFSCHPLCVCASSKITFVSIMELSAGSSPGCEEAQGLVVEQAIGGEDAPAVNVGLPGEVGEPAAGLLDEDLHGRHVPRLQLGLDIDLPLARRHHAVAEIVSEAALARGRVHEPLEPFPVTRGAKEVQSRVHEEGLAHVRARRHADPLAIGPGALALARPEELAADGIVDDPRRDLPVLLEGDEHGPDRDMADEVLGAVDGVDDPPSRRGPLLAKFFAEEAAVGEGAAQEVADGLLGLAVGLGHRRLVGLDGDLDAAAIVAEGDLAGRPRRFEGRGDRGMGHSHSPRSASTSLKTRSASTTTGMPPYVTCWKMTSATSWRVAPTLRAA